MDVSWCMFFHACVLYITWTVSAVSDFITVSQSLSDGETLVSQGGNFELGFFSPGSSKGRYLGIWYKNIPVRTVVWVANRKNPIEDFSGVMMINNTGDIVLTSKNNSAVWSTNSLKYAKEPYVQLLDTGNLVIRDYKDGDSLTYLWQSFDYPTDTLLPGMKFGWDLRTGLNRQITSWKNSDDPSPGELSNGIELHGFPEPVIRKGSSKYFRGGPFNGLRFSGAPEMRPNPVFGYKFVFNQDEVYYIFHLKNVSVMTRLVLNESLSIRQRFVWSEAEKSWKLYASVPRDYCDTFGLCGAHGICVISNSPVCQCLKGFKPKSPERWNLMDWSEGCVRSEPLDCKTQRNFAKFSGLKLPDTTNSWVNKSMNPKDCKEECLRNCACTAYTTLDISGKGSGCAFWRGDLMDIRELSDAGQDLYIRIKSSDRAGVPLLKIIISTLVTTAVLAGLLPVIYCIYKRKIKEKGENEETDLNNGNRNENLDLPFFDLATIIDATDNFSVNQKLGEGGFGPVYKGTLIDGQEIAVKRLSKISGQGSNEFKNEVILIAKLQHRNLVKLLGCCIQDEEKMLIYEYMRNRSLDSFLFDQARGKLLDWPKRFNIICGIARGLLYLHQDSRLRIIHRDLKASNVLLDDELNPKISDFGMARTFGGDQSEDNTKRIVGTYGYMAPEYAIYGLFSVKSDVFSFGILLLEIVSGKKNRGIDLPHHHHNLIGYAWRSWTEGRPFELIDPFLENSYTFPDILRCIHVALLCVQQSPEDRPNMSSVVLMLNGDGFLPQPKQPGYLIDVSSNESCPSSSQQGSYSANEVTITLLEPR